MSKFLSLSIGLLFSWICQVRCAESELSAKVVYELLSLRIDNVVRENNNLKYELKETKAVVYRLENKIERMEANISFTASRVTSYEEENSTTLLNEKIQAFEDLSATRLQKQFKTEAILLRKMLVNEKSHMKDKLMAFEQKFNSFQSDLVNNLNETNTAIETTVDNLEKTISEHNITTITRLVAIEDKLQSQLNETDLLVQEMNEDFQNKLTDSDARIEEGNIKLAENINEVDQRLTAAKSNLQSTYTGLNNRLYSTESKLRSVSSKQDRQNGQISALSSLISEEEARKVAFSARLTKKQSYYGKDERKVFDTVIYSYGGGYSSPTGIFTAPKSGTYLFTYNIQSSHLGVAHVILIIDGTMTTRALVEKGRYHNGGNVGIGYVWKGEKVWLQTSNMEDKYYIWPYRTTFNGILIA